MQFVEYTDGKRCLYFINMTEKRKIKKIFNLDKVTKVLKSIWQ